MLYCNFSFSLFVTLPSNELPVLYRDTRCSSPLTLLTEEFSLDARFSVLDPDQEYLYWIRMWPFFNDKICIMLTNFSSKWCNSSLITNIFPRKNLKNASKVLQQSHYVTLCFKGLAAVPLCNVNLKLANNSVALFRGRIRNSGSKTIWKEGFGSCWFLYLQKSLWRRYNLREHHRGSSMRPPADRKNIQRPKNKNNTFKNAWHWLYFIIV